jgi:hypothetical protein
MQTAISTQYSTAVRAIFFFLEGPEAIDTRSKNISKKEHPHRDPSTALRPGRDDKG